MNASKLTEGVKIRKAGKADAPFILKCIKGLAESVGELAHVTATEEALEGALSAEDCRIEAFIARSGNLPVGYILTYRIFSTFKAQPGCFIEDFYVLPEFRSEGIGRILFSHVMKLAADQGYWGLEWHVNVKNIRAMAFYEKLGAKCSRHKLIYRKTVE
jgi:GNAT superfamily N-acetyltransferase